MFGWNSDEGGGETWDEMIEQVEAAAAERIKKEREPFRFHVFRNDDNEVTQWAFMGDREVDGTESRVPVVVGNETDSGAIWFDYQSRFHGDREDHSVFEWAEKEAVVPSNLFYKWISEAIEAIARFHAEAERLENPDAFRDVEPDLPPVYDDMVCYEARAANFLGEILIEHHAYTEDMERLIYEAARRYPLDDEVWDAFVDGPGSDDSTEAETDTDTESDT